MANYKNIKRVNGLVWRVYGKSVFGVDPNDDKIVRISYIIRGRTGFKVVRQVFDMETRKNTESVRFWGTEAEVRRWLDRLADKIVDPNMLCYA